MNKKTNIILIVALVLLILVGTLVYWLGNNNDAKKNNEPTNVVVEVEDDESAEVANDANSESNSETEIAVDNMIVFSMAKDDIYGITITTINGDEIDFIYNDKESKWQIANNASIEINQDVLSAIVSEFTSLTTQAVIQNKSAETYGLSDQDETVKYSIADASGNTTVFNFSKLSNGNYYFNINGDNSIIYQTKELFLDYGSYTIDDFTANN